MERGEIMGNFKKATIVNKHHNVPFDVYIGRGSKWGNPFTHREGTKAEFRVESREEAIEGFRNWIGTQPDLLEAIPELQGKTLCCFCKPAGCHGDVLSELANNLTVTTWLGVKYSLQERPVFAQALWQLLFLYMEGFHELFGLVATDTTAEYLAVLEERQVNRRYLTWFGETGAPALKSLASVSYTCSLPQLAKLQFTAALLQNELERSEPNFKSTCAVLVNTLTQLEEELQELA